MVVTIVCPPAFAPIPFAPAFFFHLFFEMSCPMLLGVFSGRSTRRIGAG